jgi:uroporphyrinogen decarboxylase
VNAVSLDQTVSATWASEFIEDSCVLQGNLDPQALVVGGDALASEVRRIIAAFSARPHIFNLGHGIPQQTPPENVAALIKLVHGTSGS